MARRLFDTLRWAGAASIARPTKLINSAANTNKDF
jgi:hypothetical protein